jgi:2-methylcitrate dehydratase PrpD
MPSGETAAQKLARFCMNLSFEHISQAAARMAKRCILDSLGCALGGSRTAAGSAAIEVARRAGGTPQSTLLGTRDKTSSMIAAFANSTMANALDFDDVYFGHPGATIIPVALALAEASNASGRDFLTSIVAAYEVSMRIGRAIQPSYKRRHIVWGAGTWQVFGSVCAAAKLLGLDETQFTMALGIAGCNAPVPSNMKSLYGLAGATMVKNNFGSAAMAGVLSALLAQRGFTGPPDIFEGGTGFWRIYGSDKCDSVEMTHGLGELGEIFKISFKPYPLCRYTHSAVDGLLNLVQQHKVEPSQVQEIRIKVPRHLTRSPFNNKEPMNMLQAQFSLPFAAAVAVSGIKPGIDWLSKTRFEDPALRRTATKVKLLADQTRRWHTDIPTTVEIIANHKRYRMRVSSPRGSPENPLSDQFLEDKFTALASQVIDAESVQLLIEQVGHIESETNVNNLTRSLQPK